MYVDSAAVCTYDPNDNSSMPESTREVVLNNNFAPNVDECHQINDPHHTTIEFDLQNEIDFSTMNHNSSNSHLVSFENHQPTNWDNEIQQSQLPVNGANATYSQVSAPDFLSLVHLPSSSFVLPNTSISFTNPNDFSGYFTPSETAVDETMLHLNQLHQQQQPPFIRELLQSLPNGYNMGGISNGSNLFSNGGDEGENGRQLFENGVLEFSKEMKRSGKGKGGNKGTNTERQRRVQFGGKFTELRKLVPNPSKDDRASIVGDAIDYIKELKRTVDHLKLLVEKQICGRQRSKKHKTEQEFGAGAMDNESCNTKPVIGPHEQLHHNGSLRSSWLQRKSRDTEVDVRIIDDEVTIKLVQRKKINLMLSVSKLLDELQLELHHAAGGHIGNSYSFLFNTKMYEGSSLYACAIANKLIQTLDKEYAENSTYQ